MIGIIRKLKNRHGKCNNVGGNLFLDKKRGRMMHYATSCKHTFCIDINGNIGSKVPRPKAMDQTHTRKINWLSCEEVRKEEKKEGEKKTLELKTCKKSKPDGAFVIGD